MLPPKSFAQFGLLMGDQLLQAGIGVCRMEGEMFNNLDIPHINVSYEHVLDETFSIGGIVSYGSSTTYEDARDEYYNILSNAVSYNYVYIIFGGRSSVLFYLSALLGIDIKTAYLNFATQSMQLDDPSTTEVFYGGMLGTRMFFTEQFGAFAEIGYGIGYMNAGLFLRFW